MIVAGVMSGTSADGINVALVRIGNDLDRSRDATHAVACRASNCSATQNTHTRRKSAPAVLAAMNATRASVADLARLNFLLGELYADAILATQRQFHVKADLVGCHGQTLYHQGEPQRFLGRKSQPPGKPASPQSSRPESVPPVVSDFRPADMAAGGKGAPLVPFLDYLLFRDAHVGRIVQNIGGIANLTAIPAGAAAEPSDSPSIPAPATW